MHWTNAANIKQDNAMTYSWNILMEYLKNPQLIWSQLSSEQPNFLCLCEVRVYTEGPRLVIVWTDVRQMLKVSWSDEASSELMTIK